MSDLTPDERAAIVKSHIEDWDDVSTGPHYCRADGWTWPCDAARLLAALRAAEAERDRLRDLWVETLDD